MERLTPLLDGLPEKHFRCILADPPWNFKTRSENGLKKSASQHYKLMTTFEIASLPVADFAADDSVLMLCAIGPMLPQALWVMSAWGFTYKTMGFVWAKTSRNAQASWAPKWHMALGYWSRANAEIVLLGTRGNPKRLSKNVRQLIVAPVREHSRKPEELHASIERLCGGPRLELFSRTEREGWTCRGNEVGKFKEGSGHAQTAGVAAVFDRIRTRIAGSHAGLQGGAAHGRGRAPAG